jgi:hypothetical protein
MAISESLRPLDQQITLEAGIRYKDASVYRIIEVSIETR